MEAGGPPRYRLTVLYVPAQGFAVSLETVYGESRNQAVAQQLATQLAMVIDEGTVYLGYPVLATADERVYVDALLVSPECGLVAFQLAEDIPHSETEWSKTVDNQDRLYAVLESHLGRHEGLRSGRQLAFEIHTVTLFPEAISDAPAGVEGHFVGIDETSDLIASFDPVADELAIALEAALQRVTTIRPVRKRANVSRSGSKGHMLKEIEREIANLDRWQKRAAIETPDGPQRIRGLAGSGKTVVLALKAAYLHAQHPEWRIAVTFQSRALYSQFIDLVTRFTFEHSNDQPDFSRLQIIHAWGSSTRSGVYTEIARSMGVVPRDFNYAASMYGRDDAFAGVCGELVKNWLSDRHEPIFDALLIDEAQDLPTEFFRLVYLATKEPKRIVWAYDELQRLSETAMPSTSELFGTTPAGDDVVTITNRPGQARQDVILEVCYRNSPWALATAHALGFGIYRTDGLVQHFDDPSLWLDIGYQVAAGSPEEGERVVLERSPSSYPTYFPRLLDPDDAVVMKAFVDEEAQDAWVSQQISKNLTEDELTPEDVLVVLPSAYTAKKRSIRFGRVLAQFGIDSHLAGVGSSVDEVFVPESVAIAHIHRAKGNEAPVVYVLDSQYAEHPYGGISRRNTIFTAITRSRAWVRICGWGQAMAPIAQEVEAVSSNNFMLDFRIPTGTELAQLRRLHRDRSAAELASLERTRKRLSELVEAFERGEVDLTDLPPELRTRLIRQLSRDIDGDE